MPVCLKCGRDIEKGKNFCDECKEAGPGEVRRLMDPSRDGRYKPNRSRGMLWIAIAVLVLSLVALGIGWGILSMIPTNARVQMKVRANVCHNNLERVKKAIDRYHKDSHLYPPAGKLTSKNPLILDKYLSGPPHCPSTGHAYVIQQVPNSSKVTVVCDSGLDGHAL